MYRYSVFVPMDITYKFLEAHSFLELISENILLLGTVHVLGNMSVDTNICIQFVQYMYILSAKKGFCFFPLL